METGTDLRERMRAAGVDLGTRPESGQSSLVSACGRKVVGDEARAPST